MKINRLSKVTNPYPKQHAENPVDCFPWCKEALDKARLKDKSILLSIEHSPCHWRHVMTYEFFGGEETTKITNKYSINIKATRKEESDLDKIYQTSQILLNKKSSGWPLTIFLSRVDAL
jgi:uncharacterized protein YyaL (SSP411 family)